LSRGREKFAGGARLTLSSRVYERLRADVISGALAPGQRLTLDYLKGQYKVGITPLREALYRLSTSMLVESEDQKGFRVPDISLRQFEQIIAARAHIETLILKDSIKNGDLDWEGRVLDAHNQLQKRAMYIGADQRLSLDWQAAHRKFHYELLSGQWPFFLHHFQELLWDHFIRYRNVLFPRPLSAEILARDHEQLCQLVLDRDVEMAILVLRRHIENGAAAVFQALKERSGTETRSSPELVLELGNFVRSLPT
jgi:GntR family transcriptional regulator, carbon starvation induced regulator